MIFIKKTLKITALFIVFNTLSINAQQAQMWKLDKSHTSVNFSINHFFSEVTGKFKDFDGTFYFDTNNLEESAIQFSVNVASVDTDNTKRDNHLLSKDFFNAKDFTQMQFTSEKIEKIDDKNFVVKGNLTIKDITKPISLPLKITGQMEHPMMKGTTILGLAISTTIDRTDFGVGTGDWAATMVVGNKVKITIPIELNYKS